MKTILSLVIIFLSSNLFSQIPTNGLIGHWSFDGHAKDSTTNNNDGTVQGPTLTADRFGNSNSAYSFDGTNDYINIGSDISLMQDEFTINMWFKFDVTNKHQFLMNNVYPAGGTWGTGLFYGNGTGLRATVGAGLNDHVLSIISDTLPSTTKWQMFTITYSKDSNELTMCLDNKFLFKQNYFGTVGGFTSADSLAHFPNKDWFFGAHTYRFNNALDPYYFQGDMDDIRYYDRVLNSSEKAALFDEPNPTSISKITESEITLYPNPNDGLLKIRGIKKASVTISDLKGSLLLKTTLNDQPIDISTLPSGTYLVLLGINNQTITKKLIVK